MKRALLLLVLTSATASAQPNWSSNGGWDGQREYQRQVDDMNKKFEHDREQIERDSRKDSTFFWFFFAGIIVVGIGAMIVSASQRRRRFVVPIAASTIEPVYEEAQLPSGNFDVTVLRLAIDGRAGKLVASEMDRLAKQYETTSADGRSQFLRELGVVLRRVRQAWQWGGAVNEPMRGLGEARGVAAKHTDDARIAGSDLGDGTGIVVVTLVVTARGELMSVDHIGAEELRRALEAAAYRDANDIIDISVIARRFASVDELEQAYPPPQLVHLSSPGGGQIYCTYCGGPFPQELTTCPHCGAPAKRERAA